MELGGWLACDFFMKCQIRFRILLYHISYVKTISFSATAYSLKLIAQFHFLFFIFNFFFKNKCLTSLTISPSYVHVHVHTNRKRHEGQFGSDFVISSLKCKFYYFSYCISLLAFHLLLVVFVTQCCYFQIYFPPFFVILSPPRKVYTLYVYFFF